MLETRKNLAYDLDALCSIPSVTKTPEPRLDGKSSRQPEKGGLHLGRWETEWESQNLRHRHSDIFWDTHLLVPQAQDRNLPSLLLCSQHPPSHHRPPNLTWCPNHIVLPFLSLWLKAISRCHPFTSKIDPISNHVPPRQSLPRCWPGLGQVPLLGQLAFSRPTSSLHSAPQSVGKLLKRVSRSFAVIDKSHSLQAALSARLQPLSFPLLPLSCRVTNLASPGLCQAHSIFAIAVPSS